MRRLSIASVVPLLLILSACAEEPTSPVSTPQLAQQTSAGEEWDGTAPPPDGALTGNADIHEFDVASGHDDDMMTVTITWDPGLSLSYDLDLHVDRLDAAGEWVEIGTSTNSQDITGGTARETVDINGPAEGRYRARVVNFASTGLAYHGSITYAPLSDSPHPTAKVVTTGWTGPVKVTPENGHGYEPTLVADGYGNAFASAHPENWQIPLAPDPNAPDGTRSQSWMWHSADYGATWKNPPGLTALSVQDDQPGIEGDLAFDDGGHLYFVDTYGTDVTLTRWTVTGLDQVVFDYTRPILPALPAVDDRPWITANGTGNAFYFGNDGDKGDGGRYTVHSSYDGGLTWDNVGVPLDDSGWCRPAADVVNVYAACTNDAGTLYLYASADGGRSWQRHTIGSYNNGDATQSWPTVEVGPDGTIWVLYVDSDDLGPGGLPNTNRLFLFSSTDGGVTWTRRDLTPVPGRYEYAWLSVSPDGRRLGLGVYYRASNAEDWKVYAATWPANGYITTFVSVDDANPVSPASNDDAPADYMNSAFFPDGRLGIVWTRYAGGLVTVDRDIYFAREF